MSQTTDRPRRRLNIVRGGVLVAGAAAAIAVGAFMIGGGSPSGSHAAASSPGGVVRGQSVLDASPSTSPSPSHSPSHEQCAEVITQILAGETFDEEVARHCDADEGGGKSPADGGVLSPVCRAVITVDGTGKP